MSLERQEENAEIIERVEVLVRANVPKRLLPLADAFLSHYYGQVDAEDLAVRKISDLAGAAIAHLEFMENFKSGAPKLRVYNPQLASEGWESTHTVIEIINDDMPFLVDSVTMEVNRQSLALHLIIHPVMKTERNAAGELLTIFSHDRDAADCTGSESIIHIEVDRQTDPARLADLEAGMLRILRDVRHAVQDHAAMRANMRQLASEVTDPDHRFLDPSETSEAKALLAWLIEEHFIFLGYRNYDLVEQNGEDILRVVRGSGLGILRETSQTKVSKSFATVTAEAKKMVRVPQLLIVTKANSRSTVHRSGYLDYIGVKRFDENGMVLGEHRFLGMFASTAYHLPTANIPLLRRKVQKVLARAGFDPHGHLGKALVTILEQHPRDEMFQISDEQLFEVSMGILHLGERQRTRLFVRNDAYGRFVSCLIYAPREKINTESRLRIQEILLQAFNGRSTEYTVHLSESVLAQVLITVRTTPGNVPEYDVRAIEKKIVSAFRRWEDDLHDALLTRFGEEQGNALFHRFGNAFPAGYREDYSVNEAVTDAGIMMALGPDNELAMNLFADQAENETPLRLKVYHSGEPVPLSSSLPMLEHMGVRVLEQLIHKVDPAGVQSIYVHDFGMSVTAQFKPEISVAKPRFEEAFSRAWRGEIENDDFNRLVLRANLDWRETTILRAYSKYLRQTGITFSQAYMEQALSSNPSIAKKLIELFCARFDPAHAEEAGIELLTLTSEIGEALDSVQNLDEDRILRRFLAMIQATVRTNYFQKEAGLPKSYLSFKFNPALVPRLPEPKPMFEIYVYSTRVEGVHLRGGKVARGGLRWSDRMEDYRTEVLGLMKAQMVKNTVIVPVGSKGGFVVKQPPAERDALLQEGISCYKIFLRGLLDLTDNLVAGKVVSPSDTVHYDGEDPYLVVAADKGTATFSDIANGVAKEYGFWLDDAFASGGSVGYDHKKMGITARGAWESVKRHFRELGIDTQTTDFKVIGIGDMSGDVFGNGMLLSRHIKLIGAFDHRHIFLDPSPDPETSFIERQRLFNLPRSSWADYNTHLLSKGAGIFPRSAKSITLTPEIKSALGIDISSLPPTDLIRGLLRAPVDLLYNGGIGTYVKASKQSHAEAGDRSSDAIRVNGNELRCKVIAEGGNLGLTQLGRIEYALNGGRINTDAIDNSAGVDCSDHEVNIKILLNACVSEGGMKFDQRNQLLSKMTEEVGQLVLRDNYFQTQALGVRDRLAVDAQSRFIKYLEKLGRLNRAIEFLPSEEELRLRQASKLGLTSPERAVLLAYSKILLYDALVASKLPSDPYAIGVLVSYFPKPLLTLCRQQMDRHPLKHEIVATQITNELINRVGATFIHRIEEETGARTTSVVRAYLLTREIFDFVPLWEAIEALDNQIPDAIQAEMLIHAERLMTRGTLWFLRYRLLHQDIALTVKHFAAKVRLITGSIQDYLASEEKANVQMAADRWINNLVPADLAMRLALSESFYSALDIVEISVATGRTVKVVGSVYFAVGGKLNFAWLSGQIGALPSDTHWQALAKTALRDDLSRLQTELTRLILKKSPGAKSETALIAEWENRVAGALSRCLKMLADLQSTGTPDLSMLSVAVRELKNLA